MNRTSCTIAPQPRFQVALPTINIDSRQLGWSIIGVMTAIVLLVSMNDVYWSFKTQQVLCDTEQNVIGRWLIEIDGGDVALFMTLKMLGTMIVVAALPLIYWIRRRPGMIVARVLCTFQVLLFLYLNFGETFPIFAWL